VITLERGRVTAAVRAADFVRRAAGDSVLHVFLAADRVVDALALLGADGFDARRNGRGIYVAAEPAVRARAIHRLEQANISIEDLEVVPAAAAKETTP
jgi:hypothetical protein